ncbi:MAG TPA: hypothetical protein VED45_06530 [Steroidobacteraceae bacterium]|nr:hypothetical protein [Steroidobacteraceae bacterium]
MFLAPGAQPSAVPLNGAAAAKEPEPELELVLEDPVVDDMLTSPPAPAPITPPAATTAAATASTAPREKTNAAAERAAARVPIAKTASLAAAATKLAAANQRSPVKTASRPAAPSAPAAGPAPVTTPAASSKGPAPAARAPAPKSDAPKVDVQKADVPKANAANADAPKADAPKADAPKLDAPSLASWANARASAAARAPAAPAGTAAPAAAAAAARSAPRVAAAAPAGAAAPAASPAPPATPAQSAAVAASPHMDRDFIARNQVVERYLSGRLPIKTATEFERFCHDHPDMLDQIGLPERVNSGLRLLEASGKPEPWQEAPRPVWQKPMVMLALAAAVLVLTVALAIVAGGSASKSRRIANLQKQASERALDPATSTREIRVLPNRTGASNSPAITIGIPGGAQLADLKIDESRSPYHNFRITIDRVDQGRVAIISNLLKDSNGHLRIALNTSALGPGNYQLTLEGLDWRGAPQPDSWLTIGIQH